MTRERSLSRSIRILLDVVGGDLGPEAILEGAESALPELEGELVLLGPESLLRESLSISRFARLKQALGDRVRIENAPDTIEMTDSIRSLRAKPQASINVGMKLAASAWDQRLKGDVKTPATAMISAGHSGAMMGAALLAMGRLHGAERPAIAVTLPTLSPHGCTFLDVGANVDCKPEHLRDFALMGALYAHAERKKGHPLPRVGLLSNGEERSKGNELTRAALELIEKNPILHPAHPKSVGEFVGYVEGKEIFKGDVDVVVADGFVGNVVLKSLEGLGTAISTFLKAEAKSDPLSFAGFAMASRALRRLKRKLDYAEYGAAPLLGVSGYAYICHGRSNAKAIKNALLRAQSGLKSDFLVGLDQALKEKI